MPLTMPSTVGDYIVGFRRGLLMHSGIVFDLLAWLGACRSVGSAESILSLGVLLP